MINLSYRANEYVFKVLRATIKQTFGYLTAQVMGTNNKLKTISIKLTKALAADANEIKAGEFIRISNIIKDRKGRSFSSSYVQRDTDLNIQFFTYDRTNLEIIHAPRFTEIDVLGDLTTYTNDISIIGYVSTETTEHSADYRCFEMMDSEGFLMEVLVKHDTSTPLDARVRIKGNYTTDAGAPVIIAAVVEVLSLPPENLDDILDE